MRAATRTPVSNVTTALAKGAALLARLFRDYVEAHARRAQYEVERHRRFAADDDKRDAQPRS